MKLYHHPVSPNCRKVRATAAQLGLSLDEEVVDLLQGAQRAPAFLAKNPNAKVPVLEDGDFHLWESTAITLYLAEKNPEARLLPADARGRAEVLRWQAWEVAHLQPAIASVVREKVFKKIFNRGEPDPAIVRDGEEQFQKLGAVLNGHLEGRRFLVGDTLTVADFAVAPILVMGARAGLDPQAFTHLHAWLGRLDQLEAWRRTAPPAFPA